jgi:hypothetical protein
LTDAPPAHRILGLHHERPIARAILDDLRPGEELGPTAYRFGIPLEVLLEEQALRGETHPISRPAQLLRNSAVARALSKLILPDDPLLDSEARRYGVSPALIRNRQAKSKATKDRDRELGRKVLAVVDPEPDPMKWPLAEEIAPSLEMKVSEVRHYLNSLAYERLQSREPPTPFSEFANRPGRASPP